MAIPRSSSAFRRSRCLRSRPVRASRSCWRCGARIGVPWCSLSCSNSRWCRRSTTAGSSSRAASACGRNGSGRSTASAIWRCRTRRIGPPRRGSPGSRAGARWWKRSATATRTRRACPLTRASLPSSAGRCTSSSGAAATRRCGRDATTSTACTRQRTRRSHDRSSRAIARAGSSRALRARALRRGARSAVPGGAGTGGLPLGRDVHRRPRRRAAGSRRAPVTAGQVASSSSAPIAASTA